MLLNPSELGVSPESLQAAESLVAAYLGGTSLEAHPVAQAGMVTASIIPLIDGPLSEVTMFMLNGWAAAPMASPWHLRVAQGVVMNGLASYAPSGGSYALTYTAGWTVETLPENVKQAIVLTAQAQQSATSEGGNVVMERLGDVETRYSASAPAGSLPTGAALLLAPYRQLRL